MHINQLDVLLLDPKGRSAQRFQKAKVLISKRSSVFFRITIRLKWLTISYTGVCSLTAKSANLNYSTKTFFSVVDLTGKWTTDWLSYYCLSSFVVSWFRWIYENLLSLRPNISKLWYREKTDVLLPKWVEKVCKVSDFIKSCKMFWFVILKLLVLIESLLKF